MAKEKYVTDEGFSVEVAEAYAYGDEGLACLVIQSNEDRDIHLSEIKLCGDFSASDPETVFEFKGWIYSLLQKSDREVYIAHSGKTLRRGPHDAPQIVLDLDADVTRLCDSATGVWIVGLRGYVAHFDGERLVELPVPDATSIYMVSEAPDGTVFACGDSGGLYRLDGEAWTRIDLGIGADIYRILATGASRVLLAGEKGLCGLFEGESLRLFTPPDDRNYRAVAEYRGRIFFGAGFLGLDVVEGEDVVPFKDNIYSYYLNADGHYLIAAGLNEVARFDGEGWLAAEFT